MYKDGRRGDDGDSSKSGTRKKVGLTTETSKVGSPKKEDKRRLVDKGMCFRPNIGGRVVGGVRRRTEKQINSRGGNISGANARDAATSARKRCAEEKKIPNLTREGVGPEPNQASKEGREQELQATSDCQK